MSRIAIAIGVNRPKALSALQGAVPDAIEFTKWIGKQGFETKPFTDQAAPVTFADIFAEVERIVNAGTYSQLVIYFAGHGFQNGGSEVWLLSGAPTNPGEAISVEASVMAARESGLKSVVFISDACRSIPAGLQNSRVDGGSIFPNGPLNRNTRPEIDRLFSTLPSLVAVEAAIADDKARHEGIFTREFMRSFRDPPSGFVAQVIESGQTVEVVTNRKLKDLVRELVEDAAFEVAPQSRQLPEFILESVDAYVGRVERTQGAADISFSLPPLDGGGRLGRELKDTIPQLRTRRPLRQPPFGQPPRRPPRPSLATVAREVIGAASDPHGNVQAATVAAKGIDPSVGLEAAINSFSTAGPADHFKARTGFAVTGAGVRDAICPNFRAERLSDQLVRLWPEDEEAPSASVLIEFDNGNGVVLPGLRSYIGHIFVEGGVVTNVNYVPATSSKLWRDYEWQRPQVEAFRAAVAAAARLGVFRIAPNEAQSFADKIRSLKAFDPTLGLYAAYAYASAGVEQELASLLDFMRGDLKTALFDVAMLAGRGATPQEAGPKTILPFCPMLRQGWSLLAVRDAHLPEAVHEARDHLLPALWTTFAQGGVEILRSSIKQGDFQ
jgi:caspase domain-containing protein